MKVVTTRRLFLALFALFGAVLVYIPMCHHGAGLSPDSVGYIGTARNLVAGNGFLSFNGNTFIAQPPLYPILLATAGWLFRTDPLILSSFLNAFLFGLIIYFGGLITSRFFSNSPALFLIGTSAILVSNPLFHASLWTLTEPLFIFLVILSLLFMSTYLDKGELKYLLLLSCAISLASLTRYIGIVLIAWGILQIFLCRFESIKKKLSHLALLTLISVIPIGVWLFRNHVVSGTFLGSRAPSAYTLSENLAFVMKSLKTWYIPDIIADHRSLLILFGIAVVIYITITFKHIWQTIKGHSYQVISISVFILLYTLFLVISSTTTAYDQIGDRLLSPIFIPLTLLLLLILQPSSELWQGSHTQRAGNTLLSILLGIIFVVYPLYNTINDAVIITSTGQGYSSELWQESEIVHYLIENPSLASECAVFSNSPEVAYILGNLDSEFIPSKTLYNSPEIVNNIAVLKIELIQEEHKTCIVWFSKIKRNYLFKLNEIQTVTTLDPIALFEDGAVYSVTKKDQ